VLDPDQAVLDFWPSIIVPILVPSTNISFLCGSVQILDRVPFASPLPRLVARNGRVRDRHPGGGAGAKVASAGNFRLCSCVYLCGGEV
jgi:hypothetical protein